MDTWRKLFYELNTAIDDVIRTVCAKVGNKPHRSSYFLSPGQWKSFDGCKVENTGNTFLRVIVVQSRA
jgi:hypothetical protein